jgi:hypothetical protein
VQALLNDIGMSDTILFDADTDYETMSDIALPYYLRDEEVIRYKTELLK